MRFYALAFCLFALAVTGARAEDGLNPTQQKQVERIVRDYLVQHPEVLIEAMQAAEVKERADREAATEQIIRERHAEIFDDPSSQIGGNPKGDVTIVEFFDYRCPYCKQTQPQLDALLRQDGKIRVIYKEFPILGEDSVFASRVAVAAIKQGKYPAFHQEMMAAKGTIDKEVVLKVAGAVGLDIGRLTTDMNGPEVDAVIKKNFALADALDIGGTPAFIIDGKLIQSAVDLDELKKMVAAARHSS